MDMKIQDDASNAEPLDWKIAEKYYKDLNPNHTYTRHLYVSPDLGLGRRAGYHPQFHVTPWDHGKAGQNAWAFILTYSIIVPLAFVICLVLLGFQVGKKEEEGCKPAVVSVHVPSSSIDSSRLAWKHLFTNSCCVCRTWR